MNHGFRCAYFVTPIMAIVIGEWEYCWNESSYRRRRYWWRTVSRCHSVELRFRTSAVYCFEIALKAYSWEVDLLNQLHWAMPLTEGSGVVCNCSAYNEFILSWNPNIHYRVPTTGQFIEHLHRVFPFWDNFNFTCTPKCASLGAYFPRLVQRIKCSYNSIICSASERRDWKLTRTKKSLIYD
jgi:hypothetical protein